MLRALKLAHIIGLVMVLGSIATFVVISVLTGDASLENLAFGRRIISVGTNVLTIPCIGVLAVTGIWMGWQRCGIRDRFFQIKSLLIALVAANGVLFVAPSVTSATEIAIRSLAQGRLLLEYKAAYMQETVFGTVNVLLILVAAIVGVWRIGATSKTDD